MSRHVRNPTDAGPNDESVYKAADPLPDDRPDQAEGGHAGTSGSTTEAAASELAEENESEPSRSE
ncbi:MAG: hypothetical protein JOY78_10000 [Pseudonocardia sp.]|nr:hypothetical protein [Pseudonocardia sp.]